MKKNSVFISHSAVDTEWARSFAQALQERGLKVWFDEFAVAPGEAFIEALETGLRDSDVLVSLMDAEPSSNANLFFELGAAISMGKRIVPIVRKGVDPKALPLNLRLHRHLIRDTPERTAEDLSNVLQAA